MHCHDHAIPRRRVRLSLVVYNSIESGISNFCCTNLYKDNLNGNYQLQITTDSEVTKNLMSYY